MKKKILALLAVCWSKSTQSLNVAAFKYVNNVCPYYVKEVFDYALQSRITSTNYARLKIPFWKTNMGRKVYHILAPRFGTNSQVYWKEI